MAGIAHGQERSRPLPNIVVILTDDQRADALGVAGNPYIRTPVMDGMAMSGVRFQNAFCTTPICCTSRASILTGMYAGRNGVHDFRTPISDEHWRLSYPYALRESGYRTGFVGKYGVGGMRPDRLFDFYSGLPGNGRYLQEIDGQRRHMTDMLGDQAVSFVESCDSSRPFCLSLSFRAPHSEDYDPVPFPPPPDLASMYDEVDIPPPKLATDAHYDALPPFLKETEGRRRWKNRFPNPDRALESRRGYYGMVSGVDRVVGRIEKAVREIGAGSNTVFIVTSDNGCFLGERGLAGKWYSYEHSIRVPLLIFDPRAPRHASGAVFDRTALNVDIAPTIYELIGREVPQDMDGISLAPAITGGQIPSRDDWLFEHRFTHEGIPKSEGVMAHPWKYTRWYEIEPVFEMLFNLDADPDEERNLAGEEEFKPALERFRGRLEELKGEVAAG